MRFEQYLDGVPANRKQAFLELLKLINSMYPDADASMKYRMPTFTNGDGWLAIANQKNYLTLYLQP